MTIYAAVARTADRRTRDAGRETRNARSSPCLRSSLRSSLVSQGFGEPLLNLQDHNAQKASANMQRARFIGFSFRRASSSLRPWLRSANPSSSISSSSSGPLTWIRPGAASSCQELSGGVDGKETCHVMSWQGIFSSFMS